MDRKYCIGIGASSLVNNEECAGSFENSLREQGITFSNIATLNKFEDSLWLSFLMAQFSVPVLLFSAEILAKYKTGLSSPSDFVFRSTGCYGIAEAAALAAFGQNSKLIVPKTICCGFTYAISLGEE